MEDNNSLVPAVTNAAVVVSGNIANLIVRTRASGIIQRTQLELLKDQTAKVIAEARACQASELVAVNLEQIARAQERIDNLEKQGRLHGAALTMAMDMLNDLNDMLRRNLRKFENREWR